MIWKFENEDHTIGQLIGDAFQDHDDIIFCGVAKTDHFVRTIKITIVSTKTVKSPVKPMLEQLVMLHDKFNHIEKLLVDMSGSKKK